MGNLTNMIEKKKYWFYTNDHFYKNGQENGKKQMNKKHNFMVTSKMHQGVVVEVMSNFPVIALTSLVALLRHRHHPAAGHDQQVAGAS